MKALLYFFLFLTPSILVGEMYFPDVDLGELFQAVQLERVFPDSKTFPDSNPTTCPKEIVAAYQNNRDIDLKAFVQAHFTLPEPVAYPEPYYEKMEDYLANWDIFIRSSTDVSNQITSLIPLPYPYVVAGGRFREVYYWDSFFIMLGLALSDRWDLVNQTIENFSSLIDRFGFIPNGNRTYYLSRSQPPFFSLMIRLYASHYGLKKATRFLPQLEREYAFWMNKTPSDSVLNHYWDQKATPRPESYYEDFTAAQQLPEEEREAFYRNIRTTAESGWDFSSRWIDENNQLKTTEIYPVDLNSLLYHMERLIGELYRCQGCEERAHTYWKRADERKKAIQALLWDSETGFYQDYNFVKGKQTGQLTLAGVFPLLFQIADDEQAKQVASRLEKDFLHPGGLVTTLEESGEQWDYPNGWAPLQWVAVISLLNYQYKDLANNIVQRWLTTNRYQFKQTGFMYEKYNVVEPTLIAGGGEYEQQAGFGWTNGVALFFLKSFGLRARIVGNEQKHMEVLQ